MASYSGSQSTTVENSTITKDMPGLITSFGPTGAKVSVREAGENILSNFCHGYPNTDVHSTIPTLFSGNITELMDPRPSITRKEEEKRRGREINQEGEKHEYAVFNLFSRLIQQPDVCPPLLIMRTFEMDTKNPVDLKRTALMSELPGLNLQSAITAAENDFVVLMKDCGVVFIEAKGSTKDSNIRSAEKQLKNINTIVQSVLKAMTGDKQRTIPTVKLIVVPDCVDPSPVNKTPQGSCFLFKDSCDNFKQKWNDVVSELLELKSTNPFSSDEFKELSQILVGIWSASAVSAINEGVRKYQLEQNETNFSYVKQLEETDAVVDTSNVRDESHFKLQEEKLNPYTNIVRTTEQDIFRSCNDIKLCYLTPAQKEVFDHHKQALIHGVSGSGKSLILLFKVLELVHTSESRILILAPTPHNTRIHNFLRSNIVSADMIDEFPPSTSTESKVFVMNIEKFFRVKQSTLMDYDLSKYHLFLDDAQHMKFDTEEDDDSLSDDANSSANKKGEDGKDDAYVTKNQNNDDDRESLNKESHTVEYRPRTTEDNENYSVSFYDVGDFIERAYETCLQHNNYCWFMLDVMQGQSIRGDGKYSVDLFETRDKQPRDYNIPLIQLQHVMRNTIEVIQLTNEIHTDYANRYQSFYLPRPQVGHRVTSRVPLHHKLQCGAGDIYKVQFIIVRLREELKFVTKPPYSLPPSSVAIIWDYELHLNQLKEVITAFLTTEFGTQPQTIEEQLTSNNKRDIIMDVWDNVMSFESPVVVFIRSGSGRYVGDRFPYNICTRARVSLVVIDVTLYPYFDDYNNIHTVKWRPANNTDNTFNK